ncbi:TonB-dependent receptor [Marivirga arenosa]|uniref:TonB-dependent receptor n=1 Tax=Marivirga arenosa TaxID=3059076 RepID=A0AA51R5N8_9BACT|nr:TonB-dependent receptor [Marivirga sp. ABR2-2]WMN05887.1 TonB-dependent receptor [Marivirga sp. ABR2-2]
MKIKVGIFTVAFLLISTLLVAQKGTIRGKVIDNKTGEEMIGVSVVIKGTANGAATDLDGAFSFGAAPGVYDLQVSFISFETLTVSGIEVKAGEVSNVGTIRLGESVEQMQEVVVKAEAIRETEAALLTVKKKSANIMDGISSETFQLIGDSHAATAVKRVAGVSIQDGQYVFVRGLGDRYTKTTLNKMNIPGLDPDKNAVQMDIFPTSLINNIIVYKSFTPELNADFVGGTVDIELKDFPTAKTSSFSFSTTYNPSMHFQSDYRSYEGGSLDFLGIDDGTRDLPYNAKLDGGKLQSTIPTNDESIRFLSNVTRSFDSKMAAQVYGNNLPDMSASYSRGNQFDINTYKLGYNLAINYNKSTNHYQNAIDGYYLRPQDADEFELISDNIYEGPLSSRDTRLSGLAGLSLKTDASKYSLKVLRIQNGISRAGQRTRTASLTNSYTAFLDNLEYTERIMNNATLDGTHSFNRGEFEIDWILASTFSSVEDKDVRITPFTIADDEGNLAIQSQEGGEPQRIWRLLDEQNYSGRVDFKKGFNLNENESKISFGVSEDFKQRDYEIQDFGIDFFGNQNLLELNGDADRIFLPENIIGELEGVDDSRFGTYVGTRFTPSNAFNGSINIVGAYVSSELVFTDQIKAIVGVRSEKYDQFFTGQNQNGSRVFENENVLSSLKLFPSLNLTYSPFDDTNLRASYSKTVARPSFKEKSTLEIPDVLTGLTFIGNIDLVETDIDNLDLRYEMFMSRGQTVSVGAFFKRFVNPIELVRNDIQSDNVSPQNVGNGQIMGAEFEIRKSLDFITPALENFLFKGNFTYASSFIERNETEADGTKNGLRTGEEYSDRRDFLGQPPYIINAGLDYVDFETGFESSIAYNIQGPTLAIVGVNRTPSTYTVPFHSLNFNMSKTFGLDGKNKIGLRVNNILGDIQERVFRSFNAEDQIEFSRTPGRSFRIKYSRTF